MARPRVPLSIILSCHGAAPRDSVIRVRTCLRYTDPAHELILVAGNTDAASRRTLGAFAASQGPRLRLLAYAEPLDAATLYNRAARKAKGGALLFCDPTIRFFDRSRLLLAPMLELAQRSGAGPIGCLLLEQDRKHVFAAGLAAADGPFVRIYGGHTLKRIIRFRGTRTYPYDAHKSRPVMAAAGALMLSSAAFRALGGFRGTAATGSSQAMVDLCLRANRLQRQTWYSGSGAMLVDPAPADNLQPPGRDHQADPFSAGAPAPRPRPKPAKNWATRPGWLGLFKRYRTRR